MGLPSQNRLKRRSDFQTVYSKGIRCYGRYLTIRAFKISSDLTTESTLPKIGISISRKVSKKAVVRNRLKRQIKGVFRSLLSQISSPWLIVVIVKPEAIECKYEHFLRELEKLLIKAEIIHGH